LVWICDHARRKGLRCLLRWLVRSEPIGRTASRTFDCSKPNYKHRPGTFYVRLTALPYSSSSQKIRRPAHLCRWSTSLAIKSQQQFQFCRVEVSSMTRIRAILTLNLSFVFKLFLALHLCAHPLRNSIHLLIEDCLVQNIIQSEDNGLQTVS
jgi:hypothetical protein